MTALSIVLMVVVALLTGVGQLCMKQAAVRQGSLLGKFLSPPFLLACFFFGLCPPLSIVAAWKLPFAFWMALTSLNYIAVLALAKLFLHERIGPHKLLGAALIVAGLLIMMLC